ncbi:LlaJI family restriction endonuclease [Parvibacter caecicola]|uniref:LlaJI family restriction endonuclease n=1 Tax=Parvibacter caecicola TaxID=747645 RepID=UPI00272F5D72|nr:LlaJI family restriction endonuclease [Parvibacter caecicola]
MRIVLIKERDLIDAISVAASAGVPVDEGRRLISALSDRGVLKPASISDAAESDSTDAPEPTYADGAYCVVYVGVVLAGEIVIYCVPKYIKGSVAPSELQLVFAALRRYNSDFEDAALTTPDEGVMANRISLILALLASYEEHGLYTHQKRIQQTNGRGLIHWPATISSHLPIITDDRPLYMEYETVTSRTSDSDFISRLHQAVLSSCSTELERCGLLDVFSLTPINLSETLLDEFGDEDTIVRKIDQELGVQFITWKQDVLKLMKLYFESARADGQQSGIMFYGTNNFHVIWEKACKAAFNDMLDIKLRDLPISLDAKWQSHKEKTLLSIIPSPKWRIRAATGKLREYNRAKTIVPDIVSISVSGKSLEFTIYDAKYYAPTFGKKVTAAPGTDSVTKQLLYQSAYRDFIIDNKFTSVRNMFLIPTDGDEFVNKGNVSFEVVLDEGEPFTRFVDVLLVPANLMLECYISQRCLSIDELSAVSRQFALAGQE